MKRVQITARVVKRFPNEGLVVLVPEIGGIPLLKWGWWAPEVLLQEEKDGE